MFLFTNIDCFTYNGKHYNMKNSHENGVHKSRIYAADSSPNDPWIVYGVYNMSYRKTG